jgi:hypothetical protein
VAVLTGGSGGGSNGEAGGRTNKAIIMSEFCGKKRNHQHDVEACVAKRLVSSLGGARGGGGSQVESGRSGSEQGSVGITEFQAVRDHHPWLCVVAVASLGDSGLSLLAARLPASGSCVA